MTTATPEGVSMVPVRKSTAPGAGAMPVAPSRPPKEELEARIRRVAAEQGVTETAAAERVLGSGNHLWADDDELDQFLKAIRDNR